MIKLGGVLRKARLSKGLTLDDVASKCGYSKALLSRIENNNVFPSIDSLTRISLVLELSLYDIFSSLPTPETAVLRRGERRRLKIEEEELQLELLASDIHSIAMLPILLSDEAGSGSRRQMREHPGQEWALVTKGKMEVTVGDNTYVLKEGDTIYFDSGIPHKFVNAGKEPSEGINITFPPNY